MSGQEVRRRNDPDRLRALEEERDFLLHSLNDLEDEWSCGDLDAADYAELKDDYTVRAADAIRAIDDHRANLEAARAGRSSARVIGWVVGLLVFAIGAGWLLAQATGERGAGDQLTGEIEPSIRQQVFECQQLGGQGRIQDALVCYDEVLADDPQNVEALAYKGWFLVLTTGSAQQAGEDEAAAELLVLAETNLERAVEVDPNYPDARAFRAIVFERKGESAAACDELASLESLDPAPLMLDLVAPIAERLSCE